MVAEHPQGQLVNSPPTSMTLNNSGVRRGARDELEVILQLRSQQKR